MNKEENTIKHFREIEGVKSKIYYHYTSLEALYNIVQSKTLRLTSLLSSNDKKELSYSLDDFLKDSRVAYEQENDENVKTCFEIFIRSVEDNMEEFYKECAGKHTPYAICLSKKRDNLTHWDRYAANCTGVCIGINVSALNVLYRRTGIANFGYTLFDVGEVIYTKDKLLECIRRNLIQLVNGLFDSCKAKSINDPIDIMEKAGYIYMGGIYQSVMKFVKNSSFVDEDEVRIYHESEIIPMILGKINSIVDDSDVSLSENAQTAYRDLVEKVHIDEEHFMMSKSGIRSYRNLCLESIWGSGVIPEVTLGTMCTQNRKELERFFLSNGLGDTKIRISQIPIR